MTYLHLAASGRRDGAIGFAPDGSTVDLTTARRIEITWARYGIVSLTLTRFFRSFEVAPIDAALTMLAPLGAVMRHLTARIGEPNFRAVLKCHLTEAPSTATPICYTARPDGAHVVALRALPPGEEVRVDAKILAPLSMSGAAPRLRLPLTFADVLYPRTWGTTERATAVLIVSPRCGVVLRDGRPIGDGPATIYGDAPIELVFPQAGESF